MVQNRPASAGYTAEMGPIPGLERFSGGEWQTRSSILTRNKLTYRGAWWAVVHRAAKVGHN